MPDARIQALSAGDDRTPSARLITVTSETALAGSTRYVEIIGDGILQPATTPTSAWSLVHHFRALGLRATFEDRDGRGLPLDDSDGR
jgi:hypothetical protein